MCYAAATNQISWRPDDSRELKQRHSAQYRTCLSPGCLSKVRMPCPSILDALSARSTPKASICMFESGGSSFFSRNHMPLSKVLGGITAALQ